MSIQTIEVNYKTTCDGPDWTLYRHPGMLFDTLMVIGLHNAVKRMADDNIPYKDLLNEIKKVEKKLIHEDKIRSRCKIERNDDQIEIITKSYIFPRFYILKVNPLSRLLKNPLPEKIDLPSEEVVDKLLEKTREQQEAIENTKHE